MFVVALGGDGAPGSGTVFLVSFLNAANRLASSAENFLVFGPKVTESSIIVRRFVLKVISGMKYHESKGFEVFIKGRKFKVEFKLGELPNHTKMLCFFAGELSNCAHYFSTFANVNKADCNDIKKQLDDERMIESRSHLEKG